jgi:hypothetical protein
VAGVAAAGVAIGAAGATGAGGAGAGSGPRAAAAAPPRIEGRSTGRTAYTSGADMTVRRSASMASTDS